MQCDRHGYLILGQGIKCLTSKVVRYKLFY